jgi:membrane associated rhomboid family serine protease
MRKPWSAGGRSVLLRSTKTTIKQVFSILAVLWAMYFASLIWPRLAGWGICPRTRDGLVGILMAPLLHANMLHITANSIALALLLFSALSYSRALTTDVIVVTWVLGGGLVWVFGQASLHGLPVVHIGASGIVFGLIGFLVFAGLWRRDWRAVALSVLILFLYGGAILSLLRVVPGISWSSHVFGFAAGVLTARVTRQDGR